MSADSCVRIGLVLPDVLGTYGDGGNAVVLRQRLAWRSVDAEIVPIALDGAMPDSLDVYVLGGGEDAAQSLACRYLAEQGALRRAADRGAVLFAVCAGLQILGEWFTDNGQRRDGLGLIDIRTSPVRDRSIGEIVSAPLVAGLREPLSGFENHQGQTELGPGASALGTVTRGVGNGDGTDGAVAGHVLTTYLHGPALARNPELADLLLEWATGAPLEPLDLPAVTELRRQRLAGAQSRSVGAAPAAAGAS